MNERLKELMKQADYPAPELALRAHKLAELMTTEFIGLLEYEIAMLEKYKTAACNDFDRSWHEGKIVHFNKLIEMCFVVFGVKE